MAGEGQVPDPILRSSCAGGEPDFARNYSIRQMWMVLLSLLAFLPCSQVSALLAGEQLPVVAVH